MNMFQELSNSNDKETLVEQEKGDFIKKVSVQGENKHIKSQNSKKTSKGDKKTDLSNLRSEKPITQMADMIEDCLEAGEPSQPKMGLVTDFEDQMVVDLVAAHNVEEKELGPMQIDPIETYTKPIILESNVLLSADPTLEAGKESLRSERQNTQHNREDKHGREVFPPTLRLQNGKGNDSEPIVPADRRCGQRKEQHARVAREGLALAWERRLRRVELEVDSEVVLNLINSADTKTHPLGFIIDDCRRLMGMPWECITRHTLRSGNSCADALAKMGHDMEDELQCWDTPLEQLLQWLEGDC
ncbi:hypothetical protein RD792_004596 [Penstemon davidsonii]|uniref:RNase H type-1 domain-containing protein n=1 Tax=Penstemon davidsonii TaxID=160366 RepID=A0ABR0DHU7_9LAMI|nr:hypothetical protein RD792_004596 [Penstemon davidsonii]